MRPQGCFRRTVYLSPYAGSIPGDLMFVTDDGAPVSLLNVYRPYENKPATPSVSDREAFPYDQTRHLYATTVDNFEKGCAAPLQRFSPAKHIGSQWVVLATSDKVTATAVVPSVADSRFLDVPTSDRTRLRLSTAATFPSGAQVFLLDGDRDVARDAATALAGALTSSALVLAPAKDRWTKEEVDKMIEHMSMRHSEPFGIVMVDADRMDPGTADMLLKPLESPASNIKVFLVASSPIRSTLHGRAFHIGVDAPPAEVRMRHYIEQGVDAATAERLDTAVAHRTDLAAAAIATSLVDELCAALNMSDADLTTPATSAKQTAEAIAKMAKTMTPHLESVSDVKVTTRMLARRLIERTVERLHIALKSGDASPTDVAHALNVASDALYGVEKFVSPVTVLSALFAAVADPLSQASDIQPN